MEKTVWKGMHDGEECELFFKEKTNDGEIGTANVSSLWRAI